MTELAPMLIVMTLVSYWSLRTVSRPGHLRMAWRKGEEEGRRRKMVKVMMTMLI